MLSAKSLQIKVGNKIFLFFILLLLLTGIVYAFSLEFYEGLNLISVPVNLSNKTPEWLCGQVNCSSILAYSGGRWLSHNPDRPDFLNTLKTINETIGLWINVNEDNSLTVNGELRNIPINYYEGWNLAGYPGLTARAIEEAYNISKIEFIFMFNKTWSGYPDSALENITPGFGYWVKAKEDFTLILNNVPVIDLIEILPDDSGDAGVQVMPNANDVKEVTINVEVTDLDGADNIVSVKALTPKGLINLNKIDNIDFDTANYSGIFYMNYSDTTGDYFIYVNASDSFITVNSTAAFEYLELIALELDTNNINFGNLVPLVTGNLIGDLDMETKAPTIRNMGNSIIDVEILGTNLTGTSETIAVENVKYRFDDGVYDTLKETSSSIDLDLSVNTMNKVDFEITIPEAILPDDYTSSITIIAK